MLLGKFTPDTATTRHTVIDLDGQGFPILDDDEHPASLLRAMSAPAYPQGAIARPSSPQRGPAPTSRPAREGHR